MKSQGNQSIRWPILLVVCLLAVGFAVFLQRSALPNDEQIGQGEQKQVEKDIVQNTSNAIIQSVTGQPKTQSTNPLRVRNTKQKLVEKMSALAARDGITEEVEKAIYEVVALGEGIIPDLKRLIQSDQSLNVREASARALAEMGTPLSVKTLLEGVFAENDDDQRRTLISSLHSLSNPAPSAELVSALLKSQDPIVFPTVRDTLARVADGTSTRIIAKSFGSDAPEGWQQSNLMGALLRVSSEAAVSALHEITIADANFSLRTQAAIALGHIGNQEAIQSLLDALDQAPSEALKQVYIESLSSVNNKQSLNVLVSLLNQRTNETTRYAAARALGNIPDEESANALRNALRTETSSTVKKAIEKSLNNLAQRVVIK